jgi:hypothetical protein
MDAMTIPDVWAGQDRALTVEDMENMPDAARTRRGGRLSQNPAL